MTARTLTSSDRLYTKPEPIFEPEAVPRSSECEILGIFKTEIHLVVLSV